MNLIEPPWFVQFVILLIYLVPAAVAVWAAITLQRVRTTQLEMLRQLTAIEHLLKPR